MSKAYREPMDTLGHMDAWDSRSHVAHEAIVTRKLWVFKEASAMTVRAFSSSAFVHPGSNFGSFGGVCLNSEASFYRPRDARIFVSNGPCSSDFGSWLMVVQFVHLYR